MQPLLQTPHNCALIELTIASQDEKARAQAQIIQQLQAQISTLQSAMSVMTEHNYSLGQENAALQQKVTDLMRQLSWKGHHSYPNSPSPKPRIQSPVPTYGRFSPQQGN